MVPCLVRTPLLAAVAKLTQLRGDTLYTILPVACNNIVCKKKTVTPTLVYSATSDVAVQPSRK